MIRTVLIYLLSVALMCPSLCFAKKIKVTIYSDEAYPPFTYEKNGEAAGIYTDILTKIFAEMDGYDVSIVTLPWKRALKYIETGQGFAIAPPYKYPAKRPYIGTYSEPILDEKVALLCRKDVPDHKKLQWPEDFERFRIGINRGYVIGGNQFLNAYARDKMHIDEAENSGNNLIKLAMGRIDCYLGSRLSINWYLNKMLKKKTIPQNVADIIDYSSYSTTESGYLGFTAKDKAFPFKKDFIRKFNKILSKLKKDGTVNRIRTEFLIKEGIRPILHRTEFNDSK